MIERLFHEAGAAGFAERFLRERNLSWAADLLRSRAHLRTAEDAACSALTGSRKPERTHAAIRDSPPSFRENHTDIACSCRSPSRWLSAHLRTVWSQGIVFDPSNYSQNMLTAARSLEQINNQIRSLENQTQMLINSTRNVSSLPTQRCRADSTRRSTRSTA